MGRCAHFKGLCVLMKACVSVGEPEEAFTLPVPTSALGRSCTHDREAMANVGTPCSQGLDQKLNVPLIAGTHSPVNPGAPQPLWTRKILLFKRPGWSWTVTPVDCYSSQGWEWIPSRFSLGWRKGYRLVHCFETGETAGDSVQGHHGLFFLFGSWVFWTESEDSGNRMKQKLFELRAKV